LSTTVDKRFLLTVTYLFVSLVAGCERAGERSGPVATAGDVAIPVNAAMRGADGYRPHLLIVKQGVTVTWTNHDSIWHTVTSDAEGLFGSEPIPAGGAFSHTFAASGTFPYHCAIPGHDMTGIVVVEP
jgi:plastocyanin